MNRPVKQRTTIHLGISKLRQRLMNKEGSAAGKIGGYSKGKVFLRKKGRLSGGLSSIRWQEFCGTRGRVIRTSFLLSLTGNVGENVRIRKTIITTLLLVFTRPVFTQPSFVMTKILNTDNVVSWVFWAPGLNIDVCRGACMSTNFQSNDKLQNHIYYKEIKTYFNSEQLS